jgi:hypothetical protein
LEDATKPEDLEEADDLEGKGMRKKHGEPWMMDFTGWVPPHLG